MKLSIKDCMELGLHDVVGKGLEQGITRIGIMGHICTGTTVIGVVTDIFYLINTIIVEPGSWLPVVRTS